MDINEKNIYTILKKIYNIKCKIQFYKILLIFLISKEIIYLDKSDMIKKN